MKTINAKEGYTFQRIHDNFIMGDTITLGIDYSTGIQREDLEEYYQQILISTINEEVEESNEIIEITDNEEVENIIEI